MLPAIVALQPTPVYDAYWQFAAERQRIFFTRIRGDSPPWTDDPILRAFKFTNAYRASDRTTQYLIRNVIYRPDLPQTPAETFFRIVLFKLFNRIETWELLEAALGTITVAKYSFERFDRVLTSAMEARRRIYSAAYIMPPGRDGSGAKHRAHLALLERMMTDRLYERLASTPTMRDAFGLLRSYPTVGDFLAYQLLIDVNYSSIIDFSEMDFVVPGPGARDGISKCFGAPRGRDAASIIRLMAEHQDAELERLGLQFETLWGRRLQLVDCQNLFCEIAKYARIAHPDVPGLSGRTRIKQRFAPRPEPLLPWYPPKWGLNERIAAEGIGRDTNALARSAR